MESFFCCHESNWSLSGTLVLSRRDLSTCIYSFRWFSIRNMLLDGMPRAPSPPWWCYLHLPSRLTYIIIGNQISRSTHLANDIQINNFVLSLRVLCYNHVYIGCSCTLYTYKLFKSYMVHRKKRRQSRWGSVLSADVRVCACTIVWLLRNGRKRTRRHTSLRYITV